MEMDNVVDMTKELYKVGDVVWFIRTFRSFYWKSGQFKEPYLLPSPQMKRITQVVHNKEGMTLYQVKGGHFTNDWVGKIVFNTEEEAKQVIERNRR